MGSSDRDEEIGLAAALGAVRRELVTAMTEADADGGPVRLGVTSLELELQTTLTRDSEASGGVKVHVVSAGLGRSRSATEVQTLRIQLDARTLTGELVQTEDRLSAPPR